MYLKTINSDQVWHFFLFWADFWVPKNDCGWLSDYSDVCLTETILGLFFQPSCNNSNAANNKVIDHEINTASSCIASCILRQILCSDILQTDCFFRRGGGCYWRSTQLALFHFFHHQVQISHHLLNIKCLVCSGTRRCSSCRWWWEECCSVASLQSQVSVLIMSTWHPLLPTPHQAH